MLNVFIRQTHFLVVTLTHVSPKAPEAFREIMKNSVAGEKIIYANSII